MSAQAIQAGEAFVALNVNQNQFNKSLVEISSKLDDLGKRTKSLTNLMNGAFNGAAKSLKPLGDVISLTGISIDVVGTSLLSFCSNLQKATYCGELLTFSQLKSQVATNLSRVALEKNIVVQYGLAAASYVAAAGMKVLGVAQSFLNVAMFGCPLTWFIGGIAAVCAAVGGAMYFFGAFNDKLADHAKAMEELCKRNDSYRESAKKCLDTLEEFGNKTSLSSEQLNASKSAWNDLERTTQQLGINLQDLGITFDNGKGKINASAEAMKALKKEMRAKELEELNKTIQAQGEYIDDLNIKLKNAKTWSWRSFGTYVTFGYVDNAEEIQKQIDEESQKLQETQDKRKTIIDFSAEYKENEAKLKEIYDKDAEAFKNALAIKIDNIKKEFAERAKILQQLIDEAEERKDLSDEEKKSLQERKEALAGLNEEEAIRIDLLYEEQKAQIQKIQDDYNTKKAENEENKEWHESLEFDPKVTKWDAENKFKEADSAFNAAIEAAKAIDENTFKEEIERLNAEVERTRKEADKWYARREEAAKKVADIEKKAAEDAQKAAEEEAKAKQKAAEEEKNRLKQLDDIEKNYKSKNAEGDENKAWNKSLETDANGANRTAVEEFNKAEAAFNKALEAARNATENTSKEELERLNDEVARTQKEAEKWRARKDESANKVAENEKRKEDEQSSRLQQIEDLRNGKQEERAKKEEQESWKEEVKTDSGEARNRAQSELDKLNGQSAAQYAKLQELAKSGSSEAYQKQLAAVRKMEEDIDLWQSRINEIDIAELEASKESTKPADIQVLAAGTMDAQKKFLELQQATKNPLEEKMDESNRLLRRVAESSENLEGQMEAV